MCCMLFTIYTRWLCYVNMDSNQGVQTSKWNTIVGFKFLLKLNPQNHSIFDFFYGIFELQERKWWECYSYKLCRTELNWAYLEKAKQSSKYQKLNWDWRRDWNCVYNFFTFYLFFVLFVYFFSFVSIILYWNDVRLSTHEVWNEKKKYKQANILSSLYRSVLSFDSDLNALFSTFILYVRCVYKNVMMVYGFQMWNETVCFTIFYFIYIVFNFFLFILKNFHSHSTSFVQISSWQDHIVICLFCIMYSNLFIICLFIKSSLQFFFYLHKNKKNSDENRE